jgi:hypothetical protein
MGFTEDIMDGRELRLPYLDTQPIDLAVLGAGKILLAFSGWWLDANATFGGALVWFESEVTPSVQTDNDKSPVDWHIADEEGALIALPSDEDMAHRLAKMRRRTDVSRGQYLSALQDLAEANGGDDGYDFDPWIAAVLARPRVDPVAEIRAANTMDRKIGRLILRNSDNEVVDILVIDENGNAATGSGHAALAVYEEDWIEREQRPDLEDYLAWAATQRPYGSFTFDAPLFEGGTGPIEDIAQHALSRSR